MQSKDRSIYYRSDSILAKESIDAFQIVAQILKEILRFSLTNLFYSSSSIPHQEHNTIVWKHAINKTSKQKFGVKIKRIQYSS